MHRLILAEGRQEFGHFAHHMNHLMHRILQSGFTCDPKASDWTPAVDVCETPDHYEIVVELAGVRRENIEVYTEGGNLTVGGWRGDPTSPRKVCLHQLEIQQGQFLRRLRLPDDADETAVVAKFREGLLRITLSKRPAAGDEGGPSQGE